MTRSPQSGSSGDPVTTGRAATHRSNDARDVEASAAGETRRARKTRRRFLQTLGSATAFGAAGTTGAGVAGAQDEKVETEDDVSVPWDVHSSGVSDWTFTNGTATEAEVAAAPEITVEDDRLVVSGATEFPRSDCDGIAPRHVHYDDQWGRVGVEVAAFGDDELDSDVDPADLECGDASERVSYELTVVPDGAIEGYYVEEGFTDEEPIVEYVEDHGEPTLDRAVADYEWRIVETGLSEEIAGPNVTFDGDQLVVEGVERGGPERLLMPAPSRLEYDDAADHTFQVEIEDRQGDYWMPDHGGIDPETQCRYELVATFEDELPPRVVVDSPSTQRETAYSAGGPRAGGIDGYEFDAEFEPTDLESEPVVEFGDGDTVGDTITVRGARSYDTTGCRAVAPLHLGFDEASGKLGVVLRDVEASAACAELAGTLVYELTVRLPAGADSVVLETQFEETTRDVHYRIAPPTTDLPDGVASFDLSVGDPYDTSRTETAVEFRDSQVVVEGVASIGSSTCGTLELDRVAWPTDRGLVVDVAATRRADAIPYEPCSSDIADAPYELSLSFDRELPRTVTVAENGDEQVTAERAGCDRTAVVGDASVRDVNCDGDYRDVTGDGTVGQGDVAEFFGKQHRDAWKQPELFDFSGNGAVTHGDVVELADYVALQ